jgi:hypothetical protein
MKIMGSIGNGSNKIACLLMIAMLLVSCLAMLTGGGHHEIVASPEARDAPGSDIAPSASSAPELRADLVPMPGAPGKIHAYYPSAALDGQLSILRETADKGDAHAACILSRSLLLCKRFAMDSPLSRYSNHYLTSLGEKESESLTRAIASYEMAASTICEGINEGDLDGIDGRIIQAAALGDDEAVRMLAMPQYSHQDVPNTRAAPRVDTEKSREHLLAIMNDAAEYGDPKALEMIFVTYSTGRLAYTRPRATVDVDPVKAIAAFRALVSVGDYYFRSRYEPAYFAEIEKSNERIVSGLSEADKARIAERERAYILAYRAENRTNSVEEELFNELPEQACAKVDAPNQGGLPTPATPASARKAHG